MWKDTVRARGIFPRSNLVLTWADQRSVPSVRTYNEFPRSDFGVGCLHFETVRDRYDRTERVGASRGLVCDRGSRSVGAPSLLQPARTYGDDAGSSLTPGEAAKRWWPHEGLAVSHRSPVVNNFVPPYIYISLFVHERQWRVSVRFCVVRQLLLLQSL